MAKLNVNFTNLLGLEREITRYMNRTYATDGMQDLEQPKECKDKNELEKKLKDLETRLKEGLGAFLDTSAFKVDPSVATNGRDKGIAVNEDAAGWLLTAQVPGVSAEQCAVTVEDDGEYSRLRMYADQRMIADYLKPTHIVDAASCRASCLNGVLRVAVPKVAPTERCIPVVDGDIGDADGATKSMTFLVSGYAAADIALTLKMPSRELIVEGRNDRMGHFRSQALDLPKGVDVGVGVDASEDGSWRGLHATCRNGILTVRCAAAPVAERRAVSVSDAFEQAADADAGAGDVKVVLEKAVPGLAAADVSVEVDPASRCVIVTTTGAAGARSGAGACSPRRCMMLVNSLPRGADLATVKAVCANGFLRVTAAAPAAPAERRVAVSADEPAHLTSTCGDSAADTAAEDAAQE